MSKNISHKENLEKARTYLKQEVAQLELRDIEPLRNLLRFYEHAYYVLNETLIKDHEYDGLFSLLKKYEDQHPDCITKESPTQRVGSDLTQGIQSIPHLTFMLSLENAYLQGDLLDFDRKVKDVMRDEFVEYVVEPKIDGASISLIYEDDKLVRAVTRGDGIRGEDVTVQVKTIRSIPLIADFKKHHIRKIEIRGEIFITKKNFITLNSSLIENGQIPLANSRNAAAGSLRMKKISEIQKRRLDVFLYRISFIEYHQENHEIKSHTDALHVLEELTFPIAKNYTTRCDNINEAFRICIDTEEKRETLPFEIDGMVIKVNKIKQQEIIGETSHHPKWATAYKFKAREKQTTIETVEFQVGRTGTITPVAKVSPVVISGAKISSISLFNEEFITEKDLRIGDTVVVERAGDVIPYIVNSIPENRTGKEIVIAFPQTCPSCKSKLQKNEADAAWRCVNDDCLDQQAERIIHFVSKNALNIKGLGEQIIRKFLKEKIIHSIVDIFSLPYERLESMEGFGKKSMDNLRESIEVSKHQSMNRIIYGLGIRFVGETTAENISLKINHVLDLVAMSIEELQAFDDIGPKVAVSIYEYFHNEKNIMLIRSLEKSGVLLNEKQQHFTENILNGATFLFTGSLSKFTRDDAELLVKNNGGKIIGSVSKKLNYLVVGESAGSKLDKAKTIDTITIINEEDFLKLMKG